jgi:hypothetical protein
MIIMIILSTLAYLNKFIVNLNSQSDPLHCQDSQQSFLMKINLFLKRWNLLDNFIYIKRRNLLSFWCNIDKRLILFLRFRCQIRSSRDNPLLWFSTEPLPNLKWRTSTLTLTQAIQQSLFLLVAHPGLLILFLIGRKLLVFMS